jgi:DNA-directed RNA polymerase specialized sigma24 family protein
MRVMADDNAFLELIRRVRARDESAATEVVRRYERALLREIRLRLRNPRLRRALDSGDICQSVLASFFLRAASGQYDLQKSEQLFRLLVVMARNKLASQARHSYVARRDPESLSSGLTGGEHLSDTGPSPSQAVDADDLCAAVLGVLSAEERQLADRRAHSEEWADIAADLGGSPENLRKKLARALSRAARQLGVDPTQGG